jgi:DNA repair exonuclease SbcCD ATPase subunit
VRGTKEVVNTTTGSDTCVELSFTVDNVPYEIARFKSDTKYGNMLKLQKNGVDISGKGLRESEKILGDVLPDLSAQLIGSVILLGQGLPQRFTNNSPSGRKEILQIVQQNVPVQIDTIKIRLHN